MYLETQDPAWLLINLKWMEQFNPFSLAALLVQGYRQVKI